MTGEWTWETHPAAWDEGVSVWHAVAPADDPHAELPARYAFAQFLPDGRRAYPFTGSHAAHDAADAANERRNR